MNMIQEAIEMDLMGENDAVGLDLWETKIDECDPRRVTWKKYINQRLGKDGQILNLYLVIVSYANETFTNIWIDKLYDVSDMGNGFIHKSLYSYRDVPLIRFIIDLAS